MYWSTFLLALWFFLYGLLAVTNFNFDFSKTVMGVIAILIALCICFEMYPRKRPPVG
jgi:hypothetical protein